MAAPPQHSAEDDGIQADTIDFPSLTLRTVARTPSPQRTHDIRNIAQLGRRVFFATFAQDVAKPESMEQYLHDNYSFEAIERDVDNPHRTCLLAEAPPLPHKDNSEQDGSRTILLGYAFLDEASSEPCLEPYPNALELLRIYTHPHAQGRGIAQRLAHAAYAHGLQRGYDHIWLGVYPKNHRAIAFYTRQGFVKFGVHSFWVGDQEDEDDVMVKSLNGLTLSKEEDGGTR